MIQPEPEGSTQGYPLVSVEVLSDAMHNLSQPLKVENTLFQSSRRYTHFYRLSHSELVDTVMSDSEDFTVTYTAVSSPFGGLSDIGSPGVDGPPMMPEDPYAYVVATFQAPPSLDYVSGPEYPPSPEFIPEPVYLEYLPPEDKILPAKEQPLPVDVLPSVDSPGYDESSDDDEDDDDVDIKEDEDEEEEEHLAPVDSTAIALPAVDHVPSVEETKPSEIDEHRDASLMAIPTPPPSPLSSWSSPLPQIPSSPLPLPKSSPTSPTYPFCYRAVMIWLRSKASSTSHSLLLPSTYHLTPPSGTPPLLPIPLPTSSPHLLPPSTDPRADVVESSYAPTVRPAGDSRPDYGFIATLDDEIMRDPERDVGYGIIDSWDEIVETMQGAPATDETKLALLIEREARMSREAWGRAMDACDFIRFKNITLRTQQGPAKGPVQPDAPEEAGNSS
nr:hypothetical protein [Tanacetum cinerariifolium]